MGFLLNCAIMKNTSEGENRLKGVVLMKMMIEDLMQKGNKTGMAVAGMGLVITGLGRMIGGTVGAGITGFGLAHVVLGVTDMFKPLLRKQI